MIKDGFIPFGPYRTYYRIVGKPSDKAPLLLLHGGPGSTHNYFEALDELAERDQRQLIMYDQIGCGLSSMPDHPQVYQAATWLRELKNLRERLHLDRIHLLGQSWGGMLAIMYLCDEMPAGIKSLILSSTLSDAQLWGQEQHRLISFMSKEDQEALLKLKQPMISLVMPISGSILGLWNCTQRQHLMRMLLNICGARKTLANWPIKRPGDPMSLRRPAISRTMTILPSCAVYTCQR